MELDVVGYLTKLKSFPNDSPLGEHARDLILKGGSSESSQQLLLQALNRVADREAVSGLVDELILKYLEFRADIHWGRDNPGPTPSDGLHCPFTTFDFTSGDALMLILFQWRHGRAPNIFSAFDSIYNLGNDRWDQSAFVHFIRTFLRKNRSYSELLDPILPQEGIVSMTTQRSEKRPFTDRAKLIAHLEEQSGPLLICLCKKNERNNASFIFLDSDGSKFSDSDDIDYSDNERKPYARSFLRQLCLQAVNNDNAKFSLEVTPTDPGHLIPTADGTREIQRYKSRADSRLKKFTEGQLNLEKIGLIDRSRHSDSGNPKYDFQTVVNFAVIEFS